VVIEAKPPSGAFHRRLHGRHAVQAEGRLESGRLGRHVHDGDQDGVVVRLDNGAQQHQAEAAAHGQKRGSTAPSRCRDVVAGQQRR
jgi:hypothetical protein